MRNGSGVGGGLSAVAAPAAAFREIEMEMVTMILVGIRAEHGIEQPARLLVDELEKPLLGARFGAFRRILPVGRRAGMVRDLAGSLRRWGSRGRGRQWFASGALFLPLLPPGCRFVVRRSPVVENA